LHTRIRVGNQILIGIGQLQDLVAVERQIAGGCPFNLAGRIDRRNAQFKTVVL